MNIREITAAAETALDCGQVLAEVDPRDVLALAAKVHQLRAQLAFAIARVELANQEGNPILSAWLPDAKRDIEI